MVTKPFPELAVNGLSEFRWVALFSIVLEQKYGLPFCGFVSAIGTEVIGAL
jgi:hypothetical protein